MIGSSHEFPLVVTGETLSKAEAKLASAVIATAALYVAVDSGCQTRIHDRLSVRPFVLVGNRADDSGVGLVMDNKGTGPAIIETFRFWKEGRELAYTEVLRSGGVGGIPAIFKVVLEPPRNAHVSPNEEKKIFWYAEPRGLDPVTNRVADISAVYEGIRVAMLGVTWDFCYCSIYNECWHTFNTYEEPRLVPSCSIFKSSFAPGHGSN